ncbi:MAG: hypothetical protein COA50_11160 [Flavobacteriaceae bacterium]|nr:MAG: hypothetical protein COA50_11160 [Flavobacteriaceae bacterium]
MKKNILLTVLFLCCAVVAFGQLKIENQNTLRGYESLPKESVYVHYNTSLLLAGEHLYYKMYCLNKATKNLSVFSKMGYVELVGKDGTTIFKHKVRLQEGKGYGDFLVPTSTASGNYKLLGYTQWMQNDSQDYFFQADISIINPYQVTEDVFPETVVDSLNVISPTLKAAANIVSSATTNQLISISGIDKKLQKREHASLVIKSAEGTLSEGSYSISIRKKDAMDKPNVSTFENSFSSFLKKGMYKNLKVADDIYIPELRGELVSGKVVDKNTNLPVANVVITLSLTGKDFIFDTSKTDENGAFYFNLNEEYYNENALVLLLAKDKENYNVILDEQYKINMTDLSFDKLVVDSDMKDFILKRSINNQIENAYADVKRNDITPIDNLVPFYRTYDEVYLLDDYTRFSSLEETFVEIIDHVWVRKSANEDPVFQIRPPLDYPESSLPPLVLIDGVFIKSHKAIMGFNSKKIKTISFSRNRYIMGPHTFQGILSMETFNRNYRESLYQADLQTVDLFKPLSQKEYFLQAYADETATNQIPDFRHQLLWQPNLEINGDESIISFSTSDVAGDYEISLEGITNAGLPVSIKQLISVE